MQLIFFGSCFWALKALFFPPVFEVILKRESMIEQANKELRRREEEGKAMQAEYQQELRKARIKAQDLIAQARSDATHEERDILESARKEAGQILQTGDASLQTYQEQNLKKIEEDTQQMAARISEKLLGRSLSA